MTYIKGFRTFFLHYPNNKLKNEIFRRKRILAKIVLSQRRTLITGKTMRRRDYHKYSKIKVRKL